jgi:[acyl-carrier-protein] S-malonyltransferase
VISGLSEAVEAAALLCEEEDGVVVPLEVSIPFHCSLLAPMVPAFERALESVTIGRPAIPVIDNVTGEALETPAAVRASLVRQLEAPVLFEESLRRMAARGARVFVQCGPGASLLGFTKRTVPEATCKTFADVASELGSPAGGVTHVAS